jgi:hypothetical protein
MPIQFGQDQLVCGVNLDERCILSAVIGMCRSHGSAEGVFDFLACAPSLYTEGSIRVHGTSILELKHASSLLNTAS